MSTADPTWSDVPEAPGVIVDPATWQGPKIAVQLVVNVEKWPLDRALPRQILPSPHGRQVVPDVVNASWVEYGMRAGFERMLDVLGDVPVAASLNSSVVRHYPRAAAQIRERGWEPVGHGTAQRSLQSVDDEVDEITRTVRELEEYFGTAPRGWLGPGLVETFSTLRVLREQGFDYVLDWTIDDFPCHLRAGADRILAVPYAVELNDSVLYAQQWYPVGELVSRFRRTLEVFEREPGPRVLSVGLHPHLVGVPHRIDELAEILRLVTASEHAEIVLPGTTAAWAAASTVVVEEA